MMGSFEMLPMLVEPSHQYEGEGVGQPMHPQDWHASPAGSDTLLPHVSAASVSYCLVIFAQ